MEKQQVIDIIRAISQHKNGAQIGTILAALDPQPPKRTLQRYIANLIAEGKITTTGNGRSIRYLVTSHKDTSKSITYHRDFLTSYIPNQSYYLGETVRNHLQTIGHPNQQRYPAGTYAKEILSRLLIDLSWNSSRLEGNTYSLLETEKLLDTGEASTDKSQQDTQMLLNHKAAIEFLVDCAEDININSYTLLNLHALLSDNLLGDPAACGRLRPIAVGIGKTTYQPLSIPQVIAECFQTIIDKAKQIKDPFEQAFFLMVQLPYLQAFEDVNKRVSRLAANIPLIKNNLCPLSFVGVEKNDYIESVLSIYEHNNIKPLTDVFITAYEASCARYSKIRQTIDEPNPIKLEHYHFIINTISHVIRNTYNKAEAINYIQKIVSEKIEAPKMQSAVIEIIETDLMSLHEGNSARYKVTRAEYLAWHKIWHKS